MPFDTKHPLTPRDTIVWKALTCGNVRHAVRISSSDSAFALCGAGPAWASDSNLPECRRCAELLEPGDAQDTATSARGLARHEGTIPALTIHRPWSTLIAMGAKTVENRGWYTNQRGPVWIHAGKQWDRVAVPFAATRGVELSPRPEDHPAGIVALANLTRVCRGRLVIDRDPACTCDSPWAVPGEHHWHLPDVHRLPEPVPCKGHQGLWWPDPDTLARLAKFLDRETS